MADRKKVQTKIDRTTQIQLGIGTGVAVGLTIAAARRNLIIGLAIGLSLVGLIVVMNRRRLETAR